MRAHAFDAYGTLFDVHAAVARHAAAIGPKADRMSELWRSRQLEYTWVLNGIGAYEDFWTLTERALDTAIGLVGGVPPAVRAALLEAYAELDAYADVRPALERLKAAGDTTVLFSNATPAMLQRALASSALASLIDVVVSVHDLRLYKPLPATYGLLAPWRAEGWQLRFYSSNRWDVAGAVACGIETIWVNRRGAPDEYPGLPPGSVKSDLATAAFA